MDSAHYLQIYDVKLIHSWTLREFENFIKGARLREIDQIENTAMAAMFNARAANGKVSVKKLFDAEKMRKQILSAEIKKPPKKHLGRFRAAQEALKNYRPQITKKGG